MYHELLDDPKVQRLPPELFKFWVNCLCLAARNEGVLPPFHDVPFAFRMSEEEAEANVSLLVKSGLLERSRSGKLRPHNWDSRQFKSDSSTDRVKRYRKRSSDVPETADVTHQIQNRTDTEQIQNRTEKKGEEERVAFGEHGHARLTPSEHSKLKEKLDGHTDDFIKQFDEWVHVAPDAKHDGIRRKDRNPYASICSWYDRAVKEGKLRRTGPKTEQQIAEEIRQRHGIH